MYCSVADLERNLNVVGYASLLFTFAVLQKFTGGSEIDSVDNSDVVNSVTPTGAIWAQL